MLTLPASRSHRHALAAAAVIAVLGGSALVPAAAFADADPVLATATAAPPPLPPITEVITIVAPPPPSPPPPAPASPCGAGASAHASQATSAAFRNATLCLLNRERTAHGRRPLRMNGRLSRAALRHSRSMVARRFFAHGSFVSRIRRAGYMRGARRWRVGENIAWGSGDRASPQAIVRAWMASPGHRRNILSGYREIGIGIQAGAPIGGASDAATYTTDFGRRG